MQWQHLSRLVGLALAFLSSCPSRYFVRKTSPLLEDGGFVTFAKTGGRFKAEALAFMWSSRLWSKCSGPSQRDSIKEELAHASVPVVGLEFMTLLQCGFGL